MEGVLQLLQTYGPSIAAGGGVLLLLRYSPCARGACSVPQRRGTSHSSDRAVMTNGDQGRVTAGAPWHPARLAAGASLADLRTDLADMQAQRERLARRIAVLETAAPHAGRPETEAVAPAVRHG